MFYERELEFVCNVFRRSHIQPRFLSVGDKMRDVFDVNMITFFSKNTDADAKVKALLPRLDGNVIYKMTTPHGFSYVYMLLPQRGEKNVFFIGPYVSAIPSTNDIFELGEELGISPKDQKIFEQLYLSLPVISDSSYLFALLDALGDAVFGQSNYSVVDIEGERHAPVSPIHEIRDRDHDTTLINMKLMEQRYSFENEIMRAVASGQSQKVNQLISSFSEMSFEKRLPDQLRNMKNYSIIMNTILRKAAESGGVHPMYLDSVSSSYAVKIEQLSSISAINALMTDMFQSYCRLVRRHSMGEYSPTVQKAIIFIDADLSSDLTLSSIAEALNISSGYLSAVFKKETGKTITEYIREKRVKHAIYLLETTHLQIQTIATHCGIVDLQYFSKTFKKHTGKTPKEYRESIKNH